MWERSGCSNTSVSSMLQNSIYQVASSRKLVKYRLFLSLNVLIFFYIS